MKPGAPQVLFHDNHLLVLAKPAGWPTVPDESGDASLLDWGRAWVERTYAKPGRAFLGVVQRLDRPVSGVVLFARTSKAARRLTDAFRERRVHKVYRAWVVGEPLESASGQVEQWLRKDSVRRRVSAFAHPTPDSQRALTDWRALDGRGPFQELELVPHTGRPHQLRVALAFGLRRPIAGDLKYGAPTALADRSIALHARALELPHPTRDERCAFEAPAPTCAPWEEAEGKT